MNYSSHMIEVVKSATFDRWLRKLNDRRAAARVLVRIDRLAAAHQIAAAWRNDEQDH